ncbi:Peptidyl-prolyl cis-trans isomerase ppi1 [Yarrowia sp. B02]|nr:Peptidyl-prolyl cis-trans isomerase ppi1 [Yarrowia sp. B02]
MRAYLDVDSPLGKQRILLELFPERAPLACKNFVALCSNGYKNTDIHRLVAPEFIVQGGDVGRSVFGGEFAIESPGWCGLSEGGYLCMAANEEGRNLSQWFITLEGYPHLAASNTVFGRLLEPGALEYLRKLGELKVDDNYRPLEKVRIVKCGEMRWEVDQDIEQRLKRRRREEADRERDEKREGREREKEKEKSKEERHRDRSRSRERRRKSRHRSRSPRRSSEKSRELHEHDRKGHDMRRKKERERLKYRDDNPDNLRVRHWESRHERRPRSRSPSERISQQRIKEDIARHIEPRSRSPSERKEDSEDSDNTKRVKHWESRYERRPRSRSPSEKVSKERIKQDIARHLEPDRSRPYIIGTSAKEDRAEYRIVRKGRGTPTYGSSRSGRLERPN